MDERRDDETSRLYNRLRLWAAIIVGVVAVGLIVFDVFDNCVFGDRYQIPEWVIYITEATLLAIFGKTVLDKFRR